MNFDLLPPDFRVCLKPCSDFIMTEFIIKHNNIMKIMYYEAMLDFCGDFAHHLNAENYTYVDCVNSFSNYIAYNEDGMIPLRGFEIIARLCKTHFWGLETMIDDISKQIGKYASVNEMFEAINAKSILPVLKKRRKRRVNI